jgi:hypothetical protein
MALLGASRLGWHCIIDNLIALISPRINFAHMPVTMGCALPGLLFDLVELI